MTAAAQTISTAAPGTGNAVLGYTLVIPVILPVMAAVVLAPVIPAMAASFAGVPGNEVLVPVAITIPALMLALFSPAAGYLADRYGRRPLLLAALAVYGFCGIAPVWLESIYALIASRALLGLCEAAIMTCTTAMICDFFDGSEREKWLARQSSVAAVSAVIFVIAGGALGESGWRTPFFAYLLGFAMLLPVLLFTTEPAPSRDASPHGARIHWASYRWVLVLALFASMLFYIVPIQIGFLLSAQGVTSPQMVGLATGAGSFAVPLGAFMFRRNSGRPAGVLLLVGFGGIAAGLVTMSMATSYGWTVAGSVVHGFGWGLLLPVLLTWAMTHFPFELRGRGTGIFMGAVFVGQFISPLAVLAASKAGPGLAFAVGGFGVLAAGIALVSFAAARNVHAAVHRR